MDGFGGKRDANGDLPLPGGGLIVANYAENRSCGYPQWLQEMTLFHFQAKTWHEGQRYVLAVYRRSRFPTDRPGRRDYEIQFQTEGEWHEYAVPDATIEEVWAFVLPFLTRLPVVLVELML